MFDKGVITKIVIVCISIFYFPLVTSFAYANRIIIAQNHEILSPNHSELDNHYWSNNPLLNNPAPPGQTNNNTLLNNSETVAPQENVPVVPSTTNAATPSNPADTSPGKILDVDASNEGDNTLLTFSVSKGFATNIKVINFPFRVIFDAPMPYTWAVPEESLTKPVINKLISSIHYGNPDDKTFRVLASLKYPISVNKALFIPSEDTYKLIVDFRQADFISNLLNSNITIIPQTKEYYALLEKNVHSNAQQSLDSKREVAINNWIDGYLKNVDYPTPVLRSNTQYTGKKVVVVIDPGHGGKDPGAVDKKNASIKEKDIVLSISNLIATNLLKHPEISVVLTRSGDYFVPLKDRVLWAKKFNADLFVSIHADKAPNPDSEGLSVYTLSQNASDAQTQVIATNENKSDIIAGLSDDEDTEVSKILIHLLQRLKINDSVTLAKSVLSSAAQSITLLPNPLRSAGFAVLQVPETPSVLIESGFLSNEKDVQNLINADYQKLVANKIAKGIEMYLVSKNKIKQLP